MHYLPDQNTDIKLGSTVVGDGIDAGTHCNVVVYLDEPGAQQVVTPCRLICIALHQIKLYYY